MDTHSPLILRVQDAQGHTIYETNVTPERTDPIEAIRDSLAHRDEWNGSPYRDGYRDALRWVLSLFDPAESEG